MVLTGDGPGTRVAVGSERDGFEDLDRGRPGPRVVTRPPE